MKKTFMSSLSAVTAAMMLVMAGFSAVSCEEEELVNPDDPEQTDPDDDQNPDEGQDPESVAVMNEQIAALNTLLSGAPTITACVQDETSGVYTLTLSNEKKVQIIPAAEDVTALISYIEEEGVRYWAAVAEDGTKTAILGTDDAKLPLDGEVIPTLGFEDGEWKVSSDGTDWEGLGISSENTALFKSVSDAADAVTVTLADGSEIVIAKKSEAEQPADEVAIEFSDVMYDDATVTITVPEEGKFYWNYTVKDEFYDPAFILNELAWNYEYLTFYTSAYTGKVNPYGTLSSGQTYVVSVVLIEDGKDANAYTEADVITKEITTPELQSGSTLSVTLTPNESTMTSVSANITVSGEYYKLYATCMETARYEELSNDESAMITELTGYTALTEPVIENPYLSAGAERVLVAVAVDKEGKYSAVSAVEVSTKDVVFNENITITLDEPSVDLTSATIPFEVTGGDIVSFRCLRVDAVYELPNNGNYNGGDINTMSSYLASYTPSMYDFNVMDITGADFTAAMSSGEIHLTDLLTGTKYAFFMIGLDADGNATRAVTCSFTPNLNIRIIQALGPDGSPNPDYEKGKPTFNLTADPDPQFGGFYIVSGSITLPQDCKAYYSGLVDASMVSDYYNSTMSLITPNPDGNTASEIPMIEWVTSDAYIGIAWVDTDDNYHQAILTPVEDIIGIADENPDDDQPGEGESAGDNPRF